MNQYEHHEAPSGGRGCFLKILNFCQSGGLKHVHFASCGSCFGLYEQVRAVLAWFDGVFMNYMNIYEEGLFKRKFSKRAFLLVLFMNMEKWLSSYWFIKCWKGVFV
jgi:hypothetical protein